MTSVAVMVWTVLLLILPPTWHGVLVHDETNEMIIFQGGHPEAVIHITFPDGTANLTLSAEEWVALLGLSTP